ncbi:MAG: D-tyrosyl-tRNA(Tyr) deacylase [Bacteroidales bacterium]|nr:D-tyrosyl-tRNA(Tyr) deacylase [Bacteroidales bacterium]
MVPHRLDMRGRLRHPFQRRQLRQNVHKFEIVEQAETKKREVIIEAKDEAHRIRTEVDGEILLVSQFTIHASTKKGNRPSYIRAARPETAIPLYEKFILHLSHDIGKEVKTGEFGAMMEVSLVNDGPVTIIIDSKIRE